MHMSLCSTICVLVCVHICMYEYVHVCVWGVCACLRSCTEARIVYSLLQVLLYHFQPCSFEMESLSEPRVRRAANKP